MALLLILLAFIAAGYILGLVAGVYFLVRYLIPFFVLSSLAAIILAVPPVGIGLSVVVWVAWMVVHHRKHPTSSLPDAKMDS